MSILLVYPDVDGGFPKFKPQLKNLDLRPYLTLPTVITLVHFIFFRFLITICNYLIIYIYLLTSFASGTGRYKLHEHGNQTHLVYCWLKHQLYNSRAAGTQEVLGEWTA